MKQLNPNLTKVKIPVADPCDWCGTLKAKSLGAFKMWHFDTTHPTYIYRYVCSKKRCGHEWTQ